GCHLVSTHSPKPTQTRRSSLFINDPALLTKYFLSRLERNLSSPVTNAAFISLADPWSALSPYRRVLLRRRWGRPVRRSIRTDMRGRKGATPAGNRTGFASSGD